MTLIPGIPVCHLVTMITVSIAFPKLSGHLRVVKALATL